MEKFEVKPVVGFVAVNFAPARVCGVRCGVVRTMVAWAVFMFTANTTTITS